jgi:uncharacterized RDD family membrane protein YckC
MRNSALASMPEERLDLSFRIETPENVVLTYQLAGPAVRLGAYLIDLVIRVGVMIVASIVLGCAGIALPGLSIGIMLLLAFLIEWGYYVISEGFFRGRTFGKALLQLRVIQEGGYPITFWSALLRNLVRAADNLPIFGIGFCSMLFSGHFRRLGDLVAQTIVVEERRVRLPLEPIILEKIQPLPRSEICGFVPSSRTLALIESFLGRRSALTHRRGHDMAVVLAKVLAKRLDFQSDRKQVVEYPMAFLARVFATFHQVHDDDDRNDSSFNPEPTATARQTSPSPRRAVAVGSGFNDVRVEAAAGGTTP